ncbi:MAG TPA: ATP-binding cassette domain-containing protein [Hanamia sp.]|nr:ATP-binding cassette domain-containing protein [Hanamia sp.]
MQKPSIIIKDLVVRMQENTVLDEISFSLQPNENLAILGEAESGKTTLAKAIAGKIRFAGNFVTNFEDTTEKHARIELVEQRYSFKNLSGTNDFYYQQRFNSFDANDAPTIFEEILKVYANDSKKNLPCLSGGQATGSKADNINSTLEILGIDHLKNSPLIQLSSGEHKRFQLVKALVNPPKLLILDTPYTGLDILSVKKLNNILGGISEKGTQIILIPGTFPIPDFITHIASLRNKRLNFFGEKEDFLPEKLISTKEIQFSYNNDLSAVSNEEFHFDTVVKMRNISIKYGDHTIIKNLNWEIARGERWLLKGRNGAGKSSLLSFITGDHPQAYANEIYLFGKRRGTGESIWDIKQKIGYISPELHAYFDKNISCFQAIGSGYFDTIGLFRKLSKEQHNTILQWLDFLHLSDMSTKPLHSISSGFQRMILLARALVKNPPLLILDEPCHGLDQKQSDQFISLIDHICSESNKTLIYVSHNENNVSSCIQNVLELKNDGYQFYKINKPVKLAVAS